MQMLIHKIQTILRPRGLRSFLANSKNKKLKLLDVGCGNKSSIFIKKVNPQIDVFGIDIGDYNQSDESKKLYTEYILSEPELFDKAIKDMNVNFDLIISNHNIEHCNNPVKTFNAMVDRLAPGGSIFIATPSMKSINFPKRSGTLNFFDDNTHNNPVDAKKLISSMSNQIECEFYSESYQPFFWRIIGFINELSSKKKKKVLLGTWDYYGFEQILWFKKIQD
jgi:SAM-dependent methyltransferase